MHLLRRIFRRTSHLAGDRRGNVAIIAALAAPVLLGSLGLGTEVASWYANQRAQQNAADSAALAAAGNASASYDTEAKAVAARYGYKDGQEGVVVTISNAAPCPSGGNDCYSVTITKSQPLILAPFVGYAGDTTVAGAPAKRILAKAVATQGVVQRPYCLVALGQTGTTIRTNGSPFADLSGCNVMSNGDATCNGHNLNADAGDAHGTNNGCGFAQSSGMPILEDPFTDLAENIPPDPCAGSYPQSPKKKAGSVLPSDNVPSGGFTMWSGTKTICGDVVLQGIVTVNYPTTLVIYNGDLDVNNFALKTAPGASLTVIFAGDNGYTHTITGGGELDFEAPTEGPWKGVAIYQAPNLTNGTDIEAAGNSPTWNITGLVYLPHSSVTLSGAVNKSSDGSSCFVMVVNDVTINGTGSILAHGECDKAGVAMPTNPVPGRGKLVA